MVSFAVFGSGAMLFFSESYPHAVTGVLMAFILMGAGAIILDLFIVLQTVRDFSWRSMLIVSLTVVNVTLTGVLMLLFRYFSQPIAGTGPHSL